MTDDGEEDEWCGREGGKVQHEGNSKGGELRRRKGRGGCFIFFSFFFF